MSHTLRSLVEARADGRCEYCRRYQELIGESFFAVEHIVPRARGGLTVPENLAFACRRCNLLKGAAIEVLDPETAQLARLFHPRLDQWHAHFKRSNDRLQIVGLTPIGRSTVLRLRLNNPSEQRAREIQRDHLALLFPLD